MLETRMPPAAPLKSGLSTLPRPYAAAATRTARAAWALPAPDTRESTIHAQPSRRAAARRSSRSRMVRSEARLLAFAVAGTALMCAVLVVYLAAYAHVSQLGLDQARARTRLHQARQDNDVLQAQLARLQSPARIVVAAQALGMTAAKRQATYLSTGDTAAWTADGGSAQDFQVANRGTSTDGNTAATFHH